MDRVDSIMTDNVDCCNLLDNVFVAASKMKEQNVGVIPVVNNDELVGLITDRDIVIRGIAKKIPPSTKVEKLMTNDIVTVSPTTSVEEAAELMANHQIKRLPVVDNNKLIGIVSLADLATSNETDEMASEALNGISLQH